MVKKYTVIDRIDAIVKWIILIIVGVFTAFPFLWMVVSAFKTKEEIKGINMNKQRYLKKRISVLVFTKIGRASCRERV